ncbi:ankyrin repeat-containing domain protein [Pavlovales sp. CCMP2436]|nr:ankyrin repeat-containing domain protein [Pavlovales sp. CCMP2436]
MGELDIELYPAEEDPALQEEEQEKRDEDLLIATKLGEAERVLRLLFSGARHSVVDEDGWTPLHWASCHGHDAIVEALLEHGAHLEHMPKDHAQPETPHSHAAAHGGALPPGTNSPLHWAAFKGQTSCFWRLLVAGLSPLEADASGNNALHLSASAGQLMIVQACLSDGLDPRAKNLYGNTPLALATVAPIRELLKAAEKAAKEGRRFLCSASGVFCSEGECIRTEVVDRVSQPVPRPVCYSRACADRIMEVEDALARIVEGARAVPEDMLVLERAVAEAEEEGASCELLLEGTATFERLSAEMALADELAAIDVLRPLSARGALKPLALKLQTARDKGAVAQLLADTEAAIQCMLSEIALISAHVAAAPTSMAPVDELARKAERASVTLEVQIGVARGAHAEDSLCARSERLLVLLHAEKGLRNAAAAPVLAEGAEGEGPVYTHAVGEETRSLLESLDLRMAQLEAAFGAAEAAGVSGEIVAGLEQTRVEVRAAQAAEQLADDERKAKEAAAAAKAARKKKKGAAKKK